MVKAILGDKVMERGIPNIHRLGPSRYQVTGTLYGTRYFNPVETGVVPFERYQVLPGISTVPWNESRLGSGNVQDPGTWDRDGPTNGTTPVAEIRLVPFWCIPGQVPGQVPGTVMALDLTCPKSQHCMQCSAMQVYFQAYTDFLMYHIKGH